MANPVYMPEKVWRPRQWARRVTQEEQENTNGCKDSLQHQLTHSQDVLEEIIEWFECGYH